MYISYHTLNFSQFSPENFDFFGTPSYWYFLISSFPWQFLTRRKKTHAISIKNDRVRRPRVQTFWWHSSNRDSRPDTFQPYMKLFHWGVAAATTVATTAATTTATTAATTAATTVTIIAYNSLTKYRSEPVLYSYKVQCCSFLLAE